MLLGQLLLTRFQLKFHFFEIPGFFIDSLDFFLTLFFFIARRQKNARWLCPNRIFGHLPCNWRLSSGGKPGPKLDRRPAACKKEGLVFNRGLAIENHKPLDLSRALI